MRWIPVCDKPVLSIDQWSILFGSNIVSMSSYAKTWMVIILLHAFYFAVPHGRIYIICATHKTLGPKLYDFITQYSKCYLSIKSWTYKFFFSRNNLSISPPSVISERNLHPQQESNRHQCASNSKHVQYKVTPSTAAQKDRNVFFVHWQKPSYTRGRW